jgi:hypothetical protein
MVCRLPASWLPPPFSSFQGDAQRHGKLLKKLSEDQITSIEIARFAQSRERVTLRHSP